MKEWSNKISQWLGRGRDRVVHVCLLVGVLGIGLIALTEWLPTRLTDTDTTEVTVTDRQVEQAMEQRITGLLSSVAGVGQCRVMVTLESAAQSVYAADTAVSGGTTSESYLHVDTATGPVGLLLTRISPTIKGVAVVCQGAEDPAVRQRISDVVTTAFHISDRRVCVVKQK